MGEGRVSLRVCPFLNRVGEGFLKCSSFWGAQGSDEVQHRQRKNVKPVSLCYFPRLQLRASYHMAGVASCSWLVVSLFLTVRDT